MDIVIFRELKIDMLKSNTHASTLFYNHSNISKISYSETLLLKIIFKNLTTGTSKDFIKSNEFNYFEFKKPIKYWCRGSFGNDLETLRMS